MDKLLPIPEFSALLSQYLDHQSLVHCVRLSRAWNEMFIPHLWHNFGTHPSIPVRFGIRKLPGTERCGYEFPLYESVNPDQEASETVPALAICNDASFRSFHLSSYPTNPWDQFFSGIPLSGDALEAFKALLAKYGRHIRCLSILTMQGLRIFQNHCSHLKAIRCHFSFYESASEEGVIQARQDLFALVKRQGPGLTSLRIGGDLNRWIDWYPLLRASPHWRHIDVPMDKEEDYLELSSRWPNLCSAIFALPTLDAVSTQLAKPHPTLRDLELYLPSFDHRAFKAILASFPNLQRLYVRSSLDSTLELLELTRDNGSMLCIGDLGRDDEVALMLPLLPDLLIFDHNDLGESLYPVLARHCPRLRRVSTDTIAGGPAYHVDFDGQVPPPTIQLLLTSCRELTSVYAYRQPLHIQHLARETPWVCTKLKSINCRIIGVPSLSREEDALYQTIKTMAAQVGSSALLKLSDNHQRILDLGIQREQCMQLIDDHIRLTPSLEITSWGGYSLLTRFRWAS